MIRYKKFDDPPEDTRVLEFYSTADRDLAARILDAFQWAEENGIMVRSVPQGWRADSERWSIFGDSRLEAIEALRANVEPTECLRIDSLEEEHEMECQRDRERAKVEPIKLTDEDLDRIDPPEREFGDNDVDPPAWKRVHRDLCRGRPARTVRAKSSPDKRVPAELISQAARFLRRYSPTGQSMIAERLEDCSSVPVAADAMLSCPECGSDDVDNIGDGDRAQCMRCDHCWAPQQLEACPDVVDEPVTYQCAGCQTAITEGDHTGGWCSSDCVCLGAGWCNECWNRHIDRKEMHQPAILHPTTQAVLEAAENRYEGREHHMNTAVIKWVDAGRPGVVGAEKTKGESMKVPLHERLGFTPHPLEEDVKTLTALRECQELGFHVEFFAKGVGQNGDRFAHVTLPCGKHFYGKTLPEASELALAAYKAAQAPADGWYWARVHGEKEFFPREVKDGWLENYGPVEAFDIRDRLPDRPEGDE